MAKFWVARNELWAEEGREREVMISPHFMQSENANKAADYLGQIAKQLSGLTDPTAVAALLSEAEQKVRDAQLAEKFLEEVRF